MRKKEVFSAAIASLFLISIIFVSSGASDNKVNEEVYQNLNIDERVPVIIRIEPKEQFFGLKKLTIEETADSIKEELKQEDGREYKDLIAVEVTKQELDSLKNKKEVEEISYSHNFNIFLQDSVPLQNATSAWPVQLNSINITGVDETICVIDTGINFSHLDLAGKNKTACIIDCFNKNCIENCSIADDHGHGTHVAGIVAANGGIKGVAIGAKLIGVKVLNSSGSAHYSSGELDITDAIDWCVNNRGQYNISVITMSLGTSGLYTNYCDSDFTTMARAINNAIYYNISVAIASGNSGGGIPRSTTSISSPACIQNATSVSATDKDDSISSYGHYNNLTDLFATGTSINSTYSTGGYLILSGTSMAAPHVAGAFALIRSFYKLQSNRILTPSEIQNTLNLTGKKISGSGLTFSRIDIYSAIISLDAIPPNITLIAPLNNTSSYSKEYSFRCNVSDSVGLKNLTLKIWNSNSIYYQNATNVNGKFAEIEWNITGMPIGNYNWNCLAHDLNNNSAYAQTNNTLAVQYAGQQMIVIGVDGFQNNRYANMLIDGKLGNFTRLMSHGGWNGTLNITGHALTETAPGNAELATGLNETLNRVSNNTGMQPAPDGNTTFERLEAFNSSIVTGSIYGKNRDYIFAIYNNSWQEINWWQNGSTYSPNAWPNGSGYDNSIDVATKATEFIGNYSNQSFYLWVYFGVPDGSGHLSGDNSTDYNLSLINVDSGLGIILDSLENNRINESVQIIITADHGWNTGTKGHATANSDTIVLPLITNNQSMAAYNTSDGIREQCEIAPTTLDYFGVPQSSYSDIINNGCESMIERESIPPQISILSPLNQSYSSNSVTFNITSNENLSNCLITLDSWATNYTMSLSSDKKNAGYANSSIADGNYEAKFWCNDTNNNVNNTEGVAFTIAVSQQAISSSSSSLGGSGASLYKTYTIPEDQIFSGYAQEMSSKDIIKFNISKKEHTLKINEIKGTSVNITIRSAIINLLMNTGESRKFNLSSPDYYDLYVKINSIENKKVDLTIKVINESITEQQAQINASTSPKEASGQEPQEKPEASEFNGAGEKNYEYVILIIIMVLVLLIIVVAFLILRSLRTGKRGRRGRR